MKSPKLIMLCLLATGLALPAAFGATGKHPCRKDIKKYCSWVKPGGGHMMECLEAHEGALSAACRNHQKVIQTKMSSMRESCKADVERLCKDIKPGGGRVMLCLRDHLGELSPACKSEVDQKLFKKEFPAKTPDPTPMPPEAVSPQ